MNNIRKSNKNGVITIHKSDFSKLVWVSYCNRLSIDPRETDFIEVYSRFIVRSKRGTLESIVAYAEEGQLELLENKNYEKIDFKIAMENIRAGGYVYAKYDGKFVHCEYNFISGGLTIIFRSLKTLKTVKTLKDFQMLDYTYYEEA